MRIKLFDMRTPRVYVLECDIPVDVLNKKFVEDKVERVAVHVESFVESKEKPVFSYTTNILLLPKLPVTVKLVERYATSVWSDQTYASEIGTDNAKPAGPGVRGENPYTTATPKASIPVGCLMLKGT
jgi:hypothetical protein